MVSDLRKRLRPGLTASEAAEIVMKHRLAPAQISSKLVDAQQMLVLVRSMWAAGKHDDAESCLDDLLELVEEIGLGIHLDAVTEKL